MYLPAASDNVRSFTVRSSLRGRLEEETNCCLKEVPHQHRRMGDALALGVPFDVAKKGLAVADEFRLLHLHRDDMTNNEVL